MISKSVESRFRRSVAIIIGIDKYENGIPPLKTAANDARRLASTLHDLHNFEVRLFLDKDASQQRLSMLLNDQLPNELGPDDRLIFYFAGHGVALDGDDGPNGYLLPQDARRGEDDSYLFMPFVHDALLSLPVRHALIIMDSCFSGAFRWAATRDLIGIPSVIHEERFDRFVKDPAWQVITSTAHDQKAMDQLSSGSLGKRPDENGHSPFALALFEALEGKGDVVPADGGDGLITATEIYLYLESRLQPESIKEGLRQTPGLWPLSRHDKGEFVFAVPGRDLDLPPAPPLNLDNNPYRGLESYERCHSELFFGRENVIGDLEKCIETQALTVVLGASGTGKSSVVKAGLLPRLELRDGWVVLPTVRPGAYPMLSLSRVLDTAANAVAIEARIQALCDGNLKTVLCIDQFEEFVTMTHSAEEREAVLQLLLRLLKLHSNKLDIVLTLRTDFEPQFSRGELRELWNDGRYVIPAMTQNDLRECILKPASARVMYFKPNELVDQLINEVVATPGALPLLSFALSEMYIHYLGRASDDRGIERVDYEAVGGVVGSLRSRANAEYEALEDVGHQQMMRFIMLRMVAAGSGNVARRRVLRSELVFESEERNASVKTIIDRLVSARLVVTGNESSGEEDSAGEDYIEPAHDALVRAWGQLLRWVHEENERDPDDLRFQRKLTGDAEAWAQTEVKSLQKGLLWNDAGRSASIKTILNSGATWLNQRERQFANKSVASRRFNRLLWTAVMLMIAVLAMGALWQAKVATEQSKRAVTRGVATEIRAGLAEGNLHRALQIARRSAQEFNGSTEMTEAMRAISTYNSPQLASFRMPSNAQALFSFDDRRIIAYYSPDQRLDNSPFDVVALSWNGNRSEITSGATRVALSPDGSWLTMTSYTDDFGQEQDNPANCEFRFSADVFDASILGEGAQPRLSVFPAGDYSYPKIGARDSALALACGSKIFLTDVKDVPRETSWQPSGGFETGSNVKALFFGNNGQLVVVHDNSSSVYTRSGERVFKVKGEADAASAGGRLVTVVNPWTDSRILVYDSNGQLSAEFAGKDPILSRDGRRLAFENVGEISGSTVVNLESEDVIDATHTLRNGKVANIRLSEGRYNVPGKRPRFSSDGRLLMSLKGGRHDGGRDGSSAQKTWVTDAFSGRTLFDVAGEGIAFARNRPVLMTVEGANIHLWDMRRFPTKVPLKWDETWPDVDVVAFVALNSNGEYECDDGATPCLSPEDRAIFDIRNDRRVLVHRLGQEQSTSVMLGPHESFISAVDRHPSGTVAVATGNGTIQVYNIDGEPTHSFYPGRWPVQLWFSVDGQVLFARVHGDVIHQWSLSSKRELNMYPWIDKISDVDWEQLTQ
jgi:WD40 repeat protein